MRFRSEKRIVGNVLVGLLSTMALLFFYSGDAGAFGSYFTGAPGNCIACHPAPIVTTCDGCHAHGVHSSSAKNNLNLTATTDQASYAPGATVTVTLDGGYQSGWIRANLYDDNGALVDTSMGPAGLGNGAGFPVALTGTAPAAPGTYTFTAAWYGHQFDLGQVGGTTFFGPNWTPDPLNASHGEEMVATNSFTVTGGGADNTAPTVLSTVPADNATNVAAGVVVTATFSEPVDPATLDNTSFFVSDGVDNVVGTRSVVDNTIRFTPTAPLSDNTVYMATVTTAVTDIAGNPLAADLVWTFTTAVAAVPPPPAPSDDDNGIFGCAVAPSGGGTSGILGTYGFLMLVALGAAIRRRVKKGRA